MRIVVVCLIVILCACGSPQASTQSEIKVAGTTAVVAQPTKTIETPLSSCLSGTGTVESKDDYSILIVNQCTTSTPTFDVSIKFFDKTDARIGWDYDRVSSLQPGEKVRWLKPFPKKEYPQLEKFGPTRIQVFEYTAVVKE